MCLSFMEIQTHLLSGYSDKFIYHNQLIVHDPTLLLYSWPSWSLFTVISHTINTFMHYYVQQCTLTRYKRLITHFGLKTTKFRRDKGGYQDLKKIFVCHNKNDHLQQKKKKKKKTTWHFLFQNQNIFIHISYIIIKCKHRSLSKNNTKPKILYYNWCQKCVG